MKYNTTSPIVPLSYFHKPLPASLIHHHPRGWPPQLNNKIEMALSCLGMMRGYQNFGTGVSELRYRDIESLSRDDKYMSHFAMVECTIVEQQEVSGISSCDDQKCAKSLQRKGLR